MFCPTETRDARRCRAILTAICTKDDGYKPGGLPYPSSSSQVRLLEEDCGQLVDPNDVTYSEAHGTGTTAGDDKELNVIAEIFVRKDWFQYVASSM